MGGCTPGAALAKVGGHPLRTGASTIYDTKRSDGSQVSRKAKLLEKLRRSPNAVRFEQGQTPLEWYGLVLESVRGCTTLLA